MFFLFLIYFDTLDFPFYNYKNNNYNLQTARGVPKAYFIGVAKHYFSQLNNSLERRLNDRDAELCEAYLSGRSDGVGVSSDVRTNINIETAKLKWKQWLIFHSGLYGGGSEYDRETRMGRAMLYNKPKRHAAGHWFRVGYDIWAAEHSDIAKQIEVVVKVSFNLCFHLSTRIYVCFCFSILLFCL